MTRLYLDTNAIQDAAVKAVELGLTLRSQFINEPADARDLPSPSCRKLDSSLAKIALQAKELELPEKEEQMEQLLNYIQQNLIGEANGFNSCTPSFLGYVNGGALPQANVIDFYLNVINPNTGAWDIAPFFTRLELNVVHWFAKIVNYPTHQKSLGIFSEGASAANFNAIVMARQKKFPSMTNLDRGTIYMAKGTHFCNSRGARMAGIPPRNCRFIATKPNGSIILEELKSQLREDIAQGFVPFLLIGNIGTTSLGAIDDLTGMAAIAKEFDCHFHIDGACGGFFLLTERGKTQMAGVELCDSICFDFHKGMTLPYATSLLVVKDREDLVNAFTANDEMDYLKKTSASRYGMGTEEEFDADLITWADCSPELSRSAKGVKVWWMLKLHGFQAWRDQFNILLDIAEWTRKQVACIDGIVLGPGGLHVVTFRVDSSRYNTLDQANAATDQLREKINARKKIFVSMASYVEEEETKYSLVRACFQHHATTTRMAEWLVKEIQACL